MSDVGGGSLNQVTVNGEEIYTLCFFVAGMRTSIPKIGIGMI